MKAGALSRRALLRGLGAGGVLAGGARRAGGSGIDPPRPRRIVFVFIPNGINDELGWRTWVTPGAGARDFTPAGITAPLAPLRAELVYLDGIDMIDEGNPADTHVVGQNLLLTATSRARWDDGTAWRLSVDQHLAARLGQIVTPQWPSLELAVQPDERGMGAFSYLADGTPVPPRADPLAAYQELFGGLPGDPAGVGSRLLVRRSVLDAVTGDLDELRRRLGREDQQRVDAQLEAVRTMEARLAEDGRPRGAACRPPAFEGALSLDDPGAFRRVSRAQIDLLVATFACDLTRVASLLYRGGFGGLPCLFPPVSRAQTLHELSHEDKPAFDVAKRVHFEEVAYLVERLQAIPEAGGTMLDHTLVFCGTDVSNGHSHVRMPFLIIGGRALGVPVGQYLRFPPHTPHARLLASFVRLMGLPAQPFGDTGGDAGPLPELGGAD